MRNAALTDCMKLYQKLDSIICLSNDLVELDFMPLICGACIACIADKNTHVWHVLFHILVLHILFHILQSELSRFNGSGKLGLELAPSAGFHAPDLEV